MVKVRAGVLWSREAPSRGAQPLSRYGDCVATVLPSVLPATPLRVPGGLHRFEPVAKLGLLPARAM
jgi:hypothetical protein